ncbi:amino acid adenylation domain-containing protein, partial [Nocardiopsis sp. LOL_012]|uniref:amino acid adenylation domain-containing protein n=1 Tax=Nocardiopsis sp. LOL_012 TaxID=3345409 RepID=UPI003A83A6C9
MSVDCYLIGGTRVLVSCAEALLDHGVRVRGVLSEDAAVLRWAREHGIETPDPRGDLAEALSGRPFDFLFSIVNFRVLSADVLALPRIAALNFHDGPLPAFAGSNIASWALYEGVRRHAATWHLMTEQVDAGAVVAERWFPVRELSTALSLTYETAQTGIDLFTEMAPLLAQGRLPDPVPTDGAAERRYFARADRMAGGGVVHAGMSAAEAGRLSKAMDFGSFPNPVGIPALATDRDSVFVGQIRVLDRDGDCARATVLSVTDAQIRIAATDADMVLSDFTSTEGDALSGRGAAQRLGLREGEPVPAPAEGFLAVVERAQPGLRRREHRWRDRLADVRTLPLEADDFSAQASHYHRFELAFLPMCEEDRVRVRRAFLEVLAERAGVSSFDFGWSPRDAQDLAERTHGLATMRVPARFDVRDPERTEAELDRVRSWGLYATDLEVRLGMAARPPGADGPSFTRAMVLERFREDPAAVASDTEIALVLPPEGVPAVFARETAMTRDQALEFVDLVEERMFPEPEPQRTEAAATADTVDTAAEPRSPATVVELVSRVWDRSPDAVAVRTADSTITYAELDAWSAAIRDELAARGAGPGSVVGLLTGRGPELVPSMLGAARAGAAFLPLDPGYPQERLRTYAQSGEASLILTTAEREGEAHFLGTPVPVPAAGSRPEPGGDADRASSLAYILFTSGSTGTPKGVEVGHAALANFLEGVGDVLDLHPGARVLAHTTVAFDISLLELLLPLVRGATVELADEDTVASPEALTDLADAVDLVQATPSLWRLLLDTGWRPRPGLVALSGGEALPLAVAESLYGADAELWNMYGPTEATIWVSAHRVRDPGRGFVPLGEPLPGLGLHVLDGDLAAVRPGGTGALYITGAGLAEGYRGRPDLTAEVFTTLPDGRRAYRTGDDVRLHRDGSIEWLGRADAQVKVRGNRIEPAEVEACLERLEGVSAAVVAAVPFEGTGEPRLTAYLVARQAPDRADLDAWVSERLPGYMVPDAYVRLDALPLTENGKVARSRLPVPTRDTVLRRDTPTVPPQAPAAGEPARGTAAARIAEVFARVLGHTGFGEADNFFDLGGESANVVRAASAATGELGVEVGAPLIFATGTPERLAAALGLSDAPPPDLQKTEATADVSAEALRGPAASATAPGAAPAEPHPETPAPEGALAVIGMACRFPGAATPDEFWSDLAEGVDRVRPAPEGHRGWGHLWEKARGHLAGWIEGVEDFAPERFGLGDREARRLDPLQRLMLSVTDEALESAGYDGPALGAATGVFVGTIASDFPALLAGSVGHEDPHAATGTALSMVANRLSYTFGWSGPSLAVDTACSSSLVALDQARTYLRAGTVDAAVVGAANLILTPDKSLSFRRNGMLSPTGACHTFDDAADGYVRGEGCGVVVLKRLSDARRDGDPVLAVVNGTAVNHSGDHSGFLTAPSTTAQQDVVRRAMAEAGVSRLGYLEAHGTGTSLGDTIELESLRAVLADHPRGSVAIGSVKNAIGHLEPAAGIAGLIKAVLALQARRIPPMAHLSVPNRGFAFEDSPLYVSTRPEEWRGPAAAGVSSFGFGGVNAHAVLTAPSGEAAEPETGGPRLMVMSADSEESLRVLARRYLLLLDSPHRPPLAALCATAQDRPGRSHRLACVVSDTEQLEDKLRLFLAGIGDSRSLYTGRAPERAGVQERPTASASRAELDRAARLYAQGHDLLPGAGHTRVRLPSVPHEERRLWLEPAAAPSTGTAVSWPDLPEAAEHIVRGRPVLPAAGYPFRAAELLGRTAFHLTDLVFRAPAVDPVSLSGTLEEGAVAFRDGSGALLCTARVGDDAPPELGEGDSEGARPVDVAAMYEALAEAGLEYGPGFRCVRSVSALPGEAFGSLDGGGTGAGVDPRLLDGAFQVALVACGARGLYVPFSVRSLRVLGRLDGPVRVYARRDRVAAGGETVTASLVVSDASGPVVEVHGMTWKRLSSAPPNGAVEGAPATGRTLPGPAPGLRPPAVSANGHGPAVGEASAGPGASEDLASAVANWVARALELDVEEIDPEAPLQQLGMDSMLSVSTAEDLGARLGVELPPTLILETGTVTALIAELRDRYGVDSVPGAPNPEPPPARPEPTSAANGLAPRPPAPKPAAAPADRPVPAPAPSEGRHDIAVVGIDGVFPGAPDLDGLWRVLAGGEDHVREVPADRWNLEEYYSDDQSPGSVYLREAGFVREWDEFDPEFFRIPPADARWMDPQQRHLIQSAWRALEDAGPAGTRRDLSVGVFVGASYQHYRDQVVGEVVPTAAALGNHNAILANRVSHFLDLRGPSMTIDTLCSSSLVALHQAVRSIRQGECDQALVAGVRLALSPLHYHAMRSLKALSPTGRSRAFDAAADGFVPGEGVVTVLVRPLERALAEGDRVHAVIRGSAVNHGGRTSGLTVPNGAAQREAVSAALRDAGVDAGTVTMLEA